MIAEWQERVTGRIVVIGNAGRARVRVVRDREAEVVAKAVVAVKRAAGVETGAAAEVVVVRALAADRGDAAAILGDVE